MKLVLVKWYDAVSHEKSGWKPQEEVANTKPPLIRTVGWILKQDKKKIVLVSTIGDDDCDGDTTLPIGMIKEIIPLTERPKNEKA